MGFFNIVNEYCMSPSYGVYPIFMQNLAKTCRERVLYMYPTPCL